MKPAQCNNRKSNKRGSVALDITTGSLVLAGLAALTIDFVFLLLGYGANDAACRDAARAAGTTDSATAALTAARLACSAHKTDGFLVTQPQLDQSRFAFGIEQGGPQPYVRLITACKVRMPILRILAATKTDLVNTGRCYVFPALSLMQEPPRVQPVDWDSLLSVDSVGVPDTSGAIPGMGSSGTQGASE